MTPQERQLVAELFDRLASLESSPRDPDAERAIADGVARAQHATYALVQTALVQDEALKRAHARIEELEGGGQGEAPRAGFLDNMRDALFGRDERRGSVPPVRQGGLGSSGAWGQPAGAAGAGMGSGMGSGMGMGPGMGPAPMGPSPIGMGGSFLGTAAASAAGVIGGAMLLNGIRSMFGHPYGGGAAFGPGAAVASPWGGGAADSDLARQAGIDSIGSPGGRDDDASGGRAGLFGGDAQGNDDNDGNDRSDYDDNDYDSGDGGDFSGGDTDSA